MKKITSFFMLMFGFSLAYAQPTTNAPTPTTDATNVVSIYSDAYTNVATNYNPGWGQSGAVNNTYNPTGTGTDLVLAYTNFNYQGTEILTQNLSTMEFLHVDIWCNANPATSIVQVSPINNGTGVGEILVTLSHTQGSWYSVDIPKSAFTGMTWDSVFQLKFAANGPGSTVPVDIYLDNIYFWKTTSSNPTTLDLVQDFEVGGIASTFGGSSAVLAANPSGTSQVAMLTQNAGEVWQGVNISLLQNVELTTNKNMTMEVYSTSPITIAPKVIGGLAGAPDSTASATHTGSGWETLSFTFNQGLDNTTIANGVYTAFVIYLNWNSTTNNFGTPDGRVFYVDNIRGTAVATVPDPTPASPAPIPTMPDNQVYSIYNDTNSYTTNFPVVYSFGTLAGEPDLDETAAVNKAYKFNFGIAGWGQGEAMANVTTYGFVSFDYWAQPGLPNGFRFVMISNNGAVTEHVYEIGTQETLVTGEWKKVEIPMSYFTGIGFAATNFFQWKVSPFGDSVNNAGFVYVDNILLSVNSVLNNNSFETSSFKIYPNPTSNVLNIEASGNVQSLAIYNTLGQEVMNKEVSGTNVRLDVSELNAGIYIVKTNVDGKISSTKFIKE
ncbi:T9SS type A sorting domain-containing protein [Flavobacterium sp.]|uniref:T9SS type A sorting domain-containing protein n=1 Tax=Flavobacterium sp. TaxID=239 RepID=UPI003F69BA60